MYFVCVFVSFILASAITFPWTGRTESTRLLFGACCYTFWFLYWYAYVLFSLYN